MKSSLRAMPVLMGSSMVLSAVAGQALAQDVTTIEEVVVVGYRAQNAQAIQARRQDERIADYLAADDIGSQPDYNISDAIRRLPGVQTVFDEDEGKFVAIRGLNPSYTLGAFDGATLATSERSNRQLNMEAIPSGAIRQVVVTKSRTPDVDGNAIGGTLNLITRSPFDARGFYLAGTASGGISSDTVVPGEGFGRDYDDAPNWRLDATMSQRFGSSGEFGVLFGLNYLQRNRDQERLLPQQVQPSISATPTPVGTPAAAGSQTDLLWSTYPNTIERLGGILKLEWEPMTGLRAGVSFVHYVQNDNELRHSQRLRNGTGGSASFVRFNDFPLDKPTTVGQVFIDWTPDEDQTLAFRASYSEAQFLEPSNQLQFNLTGPAATFDVALQGRVPVATNLDPRLSNPASYTLASNAFTPYEDDSDEYVREVAFDYGRNTERGDTGFGVGLGAKFREIVRDNDSTTWSWVYTGAPLTLDRFAIRTDYRPPFANFNQIFNATSASFTGGRNENRQADWRFDEDVTAVYGLVRHAGSRHTLILGGRYEDTATSVERNRTQGTVQSRVTREGQYDHFLPSITFLYDITDALRLRAGASRAVGRPNPSQLASGETVNQTTGAVNRGNPDLLAREGDSYEASLEYYMPGNAGVISVGVFRKEIKNEIVTRLTIAGGPNGEDVTQPVNATVAEVQGLELNAVINNLPLPGWLSNFGVSANASFIDGSFDTGGARGTVDVLQGQADRLANVAIFYEQGPFRARAAYAYVGEAFTNVSATDVTGVTDRYDAAIGTLDLQARYTINDNFELIGEVRNATNEEKINYTGNDIYRDVSFYGRQFWIGTTFKF
ncbi:MAG: TonB-dependent receptor [Brevundimonas sp.]